MDASDKATEYEEVERDARIAHARVLAPDVLPVLDCVDCSRITQAHAKDHCGDYAACVTDWVKIQRINKIKGV